MELLICLHPDEVKSVSSLFDVTPGFLLDSFVTHYSDNGTNKCTLEEAVILNWSEYVTESSGTISCIHAVTTKLGDIYTCMYVYMLRWMEGHVSTGIHVSIYI